MNDFDFFVVKAYSPRIRPLLKFGVERKSIQTRVHYGGRFPTKSHSVSLATVDVVEIGHIKAREVAENILEGYKKRGLPEGVKLHIEFYPVD